MELCPIVDPADLTPKQTKFAALYLEHGDATRAYAEVYDVGPETPRAKVQRMAHQLRHLPKVANRIRETQAAAAEDVVISVRARMAHLQMICEADPSELVSIAGSACRWCHGAGHAYQWRSADELARALDRHVRSIGTSKPLTCPDASGGYGFRGDAEPHPACPQCDGEGISRTVVTPSSQWSPSARRLFKGVKANGEILMHDQLAASDQLNKLQAAYTSVSLNASVAVDAGPRATPETLLAAFKASRT